MFVHFDYCSLKGNGVYYRQQKGKGLHSMTKKDIISLSKSLKLPIYKAEFSDLLCMLQFYPIYGKNGGNFWVFNIPNKCILVLGNCDVSGTKFKDGLCEKYEMLASEQFRGEYDAAKAKEYIAGLWNEMLKEQNA